MMMTKVVKKILIINVIAFIIQSLLENNETWFTTLALWPMSSEFNQLHQWITHMFLHANFAHLFFNMIVFISFGAIVENFLKEKFLAFYIIAGLVGALSHYLIIGGDNPMVGASGAVFGVLTATALINPNLEVYLLFLFKVKIKVILPLIILYELYTGIMVNDNVGHFAHLGGALVGFLYISYLKKFKYV